MATGALRVNGIDSGNAIFRGHITAAGSAPAIATAAPVQLGTGPSVAIAGTDRRGTITITTGTAPAAFVAGTSVVLATVTFALTYGVAPVFISILPGNAAAARNYGGSILTFYCNAATATTLTIDAVSNATPSLAASTAYKFFYLVEG